MKADAISTGSACVNDVHSGLNRTCVRQLIQIDESSAVQKVIRHAKNAGLSVIAAGGRFSMGGQQFAADQICLDMQKLNKIIALDKERGTVRVQAGIKWPELISGLQQLQSGDLNPWCIVQKQTGADNLTIGGAIASNVHGRGLSLSPFISDVEQFKIVDATGTEKTCSRSENRELFSLAAGGYGMFGVVTEATVRLTPTRTMRRRVRLAHSSELIDLFNAEVALGCTYGDFQFSIDDRSTEFLTTGIMSTYRPVDQRVNAEAERQAALSRSDWQRLLHLAHTDKAQAFEQYKRHYLKTDGQLYSSDTFQLSTYLEGYHTQLDGHLPEQVKGTEIITEIYVPRELLHQYLIAAGKLLRERNADVIYGTVRLIEKDEDSFLAWAKQPSACIIFNLHTEHSPQGIRRSAAAFTGLIELAMALGGSYYLTYHKFASLEQVRACYPQFDDFVARKRQYDPSGLFMSDWFQHYTTGLQA